ncbi:ABC transporter permease [Candidatus Uhrbacteria bacterium]|nr:ABC transporter permease [Candidatus Uhrbacteria bacterium]
MRLADAFKTSLNGLKKSRIRTVLSMLGIVIGISSVILLMSIGSSAQLLILDQVQSIGSNLIFVVPGATKGSRFASPPSVQGIIIKTLVKSDLDALSREPAIEKVAPEVRGAGRVVFENNDALVTFEGTTEDFFDIRKFKVAKGYRFTTSDVDYDNYDTQFASARTTAILRQNHRITNPDKDDFTIRTQADAISILGNITSILTVFLTSIAFISLIVGGIGIMNIMLVSVIERTKEIGLRKAVGATNRDILQQFLFEAGMITFIGGLIGIFIGSLFTVIIYLILVRVLPSGWIFSLPISAILLAAAVSTCIGIIFGLYPARQAARKNPIEALRYE